MEITQDNSTSAELEKVITDSNIELSEAETVKQSYLPYFTQLAEIKELKKKINFENPTEIDEKIARELRLKTVKIRTTCEATKDERKKIHLLKGNLEQSVNNVVKADCQLEEELFLQVEKKREIAEKARIEALKTQRLEILQELTADASIYPLGQMSEDAFNDLVSGLKLQREAKIEAERKAEEERIENERLTKLANDRRIEIAPYVQFISGDNDLRVMPNEDYDKLLKSLQQAKIDYDLEQKRIADENARLKAEAEAKEAQRKKRSEEMKPYLVLIRDYNAMINLDEKKYQKELADIKKGEEERIAFEQKMREKQVKEIEEREIQVIAHLEQSGYKTTVGGYSNGTHFIGSNHYSFLESDDELNEIINRINEDVARAKEKAEADAKLKAEQEANAKLQAELKAKQDAEAKALQEKIDAENKAKAEAEKLAKAPDKERLIKMVDDLNIVVSLTEFKTTEAEKIETLIIDKFNAFKKWAKSEIEKL